ncbi:hypothetical protein [Pseudomonas sp.]|jgi:phosphoketolase|uniref:phosphoketolase family protein n=1 Tax=Pseudomonas sp. TaxID=306 RepID=UPI00326629BC
MRHGLTSQQLQGMDAYWRAANYLSVGQIYLQDTPSNGFRDEGTTTTPFDMAVLNSPDRFQLALDAVERVPQLSNEVGRAQERYRTMIQRHKRYISEHGEVLPHVRDWHGQAEAAMAIQSGRPCSLAPDKGY